MESLQHRLLTAEIELIAKAGYQFMAADGAEVSFSGAQTTVWEIGEQCEGNTLKLSLAFPETEKRGKSETQEARRIRAIYRTG